MNKRERSLLVAMSVALVAGGASLISDLSKRKGGPGPRSAPDLGIQVFADTQRASLAILRLRPNERTALDKATGPWAESPFIDRVGGIRTGESTVSEFRYTGYMQLGDTRLAIVNGREYRTGETIKATDFIVETIEPDQVVLAVSQSSRRVTVPRHNLQAPRNTP
jgi:hypothetical protein